LDKLKGNAWLVATHLLFTLIPGLEFWKFALVVWCYA
jgi:hypothetical protein